MEIYCFFASFHDIIHPITLIILPENEIVLVVIFSMYECLCDFWCERSTKSFSCKNIKTDTVLRVIFTRNKYVNTPWSE